MDIINADFLSIVPLWTFLILSKQKEQRLEKEGMIFINFIQEIYST